MPWWGVEVYMLGGDVVKVYPYGLEQNLGQFASYIAGAEMPAWFTPLMWLVVGLATVALLIAALIKDRSISLLGRKFSLPKLIIGVVGLAYIGGVVLAPLVIAIQTRAFFDMPLQGYFTINLGGEGLFSGAMSSFRFGYWLACGVGPLLIALALLRDKIVGKTKLD